MQIPAQHPLTRPGNWQSLALIEAISILANVVNDQYESPQDFADDLRSYAQSVELTLDPTNSTSPGDLPNLLDAVGSHLYALHMAANEIAIVTGQDAAAVVARLQYAGWERYQLALPEDVGAVVSQTLQSMKEFETCANRDCAQVIVRVEVPGNV